MKYITLHAPNHDEIYLFPTEGIIVQGDPDNDKQTLIAVQGTERRVVGYPEEIALQIERMFAPDEIEVPDVTDPAPHSEQFRRMPTLANEDTTTKLQIVVENAVLASTNPNQVIQNLALAGYHIVRL